MLFQLKTGWVEGYNQGQQPIIYLRMSAQQLLQWNLDFVFTDGHGLAAFTSWFDDLNELSQVDWAIVNQTYWNDIPTDNDRKRRKQAEFLIKHSVPWRLVEEIVVINQAAKDMVDQTLANFPQRHHPPVTIKPDWYY